MCGVDSRSSLLKHFSELTEDRLCAIAHYLHLVPEDQEPQLPKPVLLEVLVAEHERRQSQLEAMNSMPLYPTEEVLWDINLVPSEFYSGESEYMLYSGGHYCLFLVKDHHGDGISLYVLLLPDEWVHCALF